MLEYLKERDDLGDISVVRRIILKRILGMSLWRERSKLIWLWVGTGDGCMSTIMNFWISLIAGGRGCSWLVQVILCFVG